MSNANRLQTEQSAVARVHSWLISRLPAPGQEWTVAQIEDTAVRQEFLDLRERLRSKGAIEAVGYTDDSHRAIYRTDEEFYRKACNLDDTNDRLPCGCRIAWIQEGDQLRCKSCGRRYEREVIRDFLD